MSYTDSTVSDVSPIQALTQDEINSRYEKCLDDMYSLGRFGIVLGLDTMISILNGLNNPQETFPIIHIAGTNGKGSVASTLSAILTEAGYKTGLYTSPHLVSFNERICINGKHITNEEVLNAYDAVESVNTGERKATFFELNTAMAFYEFARQTVDFAIIETGMGGRLDATNIVNPVLTIITNISLEHKSYLGSTIAEIAFEKAGIIKKNIPVITGVTQKNAMAVVEKKAAEMSARVYKTGTDFKVRKSPSYVDRFFYYGVNQTIKGIDKQLPGNHQFQNASLVLAACELLNQNKHANINENAIKKGLLNVTWPGRLEIVSNAPEIIIDGAHNLAAIQKLTAFLKERYADRKLTMIIGILDDKSYDTMLKYLLPLCSRAILTMADSDRSIPADLLFDAASRYVNDVSVIHSVEKAIITAKSSAEADEVICIAGSLYVAGEAKAYFNALEAQVQI